MNETKLRRPAACLTRRGFLFASAAALATVEFLSPWGQLFTLEVAAYEQKKIGSLRELEIGEPQAFRYPWDHPHCENHLVKLGVAAGGGVGPDQDVVAFNVLCTHMGGPLQGQYKAQHQVLGPCPIHLTTFDLTRHGMVVAGHATQGLPQVQLEVREDEIYATGMMGLVYGFADNEVEP